MMTLRTPADFDALLALGLAGFDYAGDAGDGIHDFNRTDPRGDVTRWVRLSYMPDDDPAEPGFWHLTVEDVATADLRPLRYQETGHATVTNALLALTLS